MKDTSAPTFRKSFDLRKRVAHAGCEQNSAARVSGAFRCHDVKRIFPSGDRLSRILDPCQRRIRLKLSAGHPGDFRRVHAVLAEKSVSMFRKTIAADSGIDDQNAAPCAKKLQGGRHSGVAAADHDHIMLHGYPFRGRRAA